MSVRPRRECRELPCLVGILGIVSCGEGGGVLFCVLAFPFLHVSLVLKPVCDNLITPRIMLKKLEFVDIADLINDWVNEDNVKKGQK